MCGHTYVVRSFHMQNTKPSHVKFCGMHLHGTKLSSGSILYNLRDL